MRECDKNIYNKTLLDLIEISQEIVLNLIRYLPTGNVTDKIGYQGNRIR